MPKRSEKEIIRRIRDVDCGLSPENLWCDGEASDTEARATERRLRKERAALVKELGREPTFEELYERE